VVKRNFDKITGAKYLHLSVSLEEVAAGSQEEGPRGPRGVE